MFVYGTVAIIMSGIQASNIIEWMFPLWVQFWDQYSLLLQYEILEKRVTYIAAGASARESQIMTVNQIISLIQIIYVYSYLPSYSKLLILKGKVEYKVSKNKLDKNISILSLLPFPFSPFDMGNLLRQEKLRTPK